MRTAIIDLGTNSVRFDVYQLGPAGQVSRLHREKIMIRLGEEVFSNGKLGKAAVERTLAAFQRFKRLATHLRVKRTVAFATSALREAKDRRAFQTLIREKCGIDLKIISGKQEARLIAVGILTHEKLPNEKFALIDIGGGSTEISICEGKKVLHSFSFALGTARMEQVFLKGIPPAPEQVKALRLAACRELMKKIKKENWPQVNVCLGSSGTIRALSRISKKLHGHTHIARKKLETLNKKMSVMTSHELMKIPGMEAKRVDMILSGSLILEEAMAALGAKKAIPTEFSLRDGILETTLKTSGNSENSPHRSLEVFYEQAKMMGKEEKELKRAVQFADILFNKLKPIHKLNLAWRDYLAIATILKDTGQVISSTRHQEHSYYIIKNADLPFAMQWEADLIANLCRYHGRPKIDAKAVKLVTDSQKKGAFLKLLALLKMVDAVDFGINESAQFKNIVIKKSAIELSVKKNLFSSLTHNTQGAPNPLIEKVFGRQFRIVSA